MDVANNPEDTATLVAINDYLDVMGAILKKIDPFRKEHVFEKKLKEFHDLQAMLIRSTEVTATLGSSISRLLASRGQEPNRNEIPMRDALQLVMAVTGKSSGTLISNCKILQHTLTFLQEKVTLIQTRVKECIKDLEANAQSSQVGKVDGAGATGNIPKPEQCGGINPSGSGATGSRSAPLMTFEQCHHLWKEHHASRINPLNFNRVVPDIKTPKQHKQQQRSDKQRASGSGATCSQAVLEQPKNTDECQFILGGLLPVWLIQDQELDDAVDEVVTLSSDVELAIMGFIAKL